MERKVMMVIFTDSKSNKLRIRIPLASYENLQNTPSLDDWLMDDVERTVSIGVKQRLIKILMGHPDEWKWQGDDGKEGGGNYARDISGTEGEPPGGPSCIHQVKAARIIPHRATLARLLGRTGG